MECFWIGKVVVSFATSKRTYCLGRDVVLFFRLLFSGEAGGSPQSGLLYTIALIRPSNIPDSLYIFDSYCFVFSRSVTDPLFLGRRAAITCWYSAFETPR